MRWWSRKRPEPAPQEKTQFSDDSWGGLILKSGVPGMTQGPGIEASRRVARALEASGRSADELGRRLSRLTFLLLAFTVVIAVLTAVLVFTELHMWPAR